MINENDYPQNYDWMPEYVKAKMLAQLNDLNEHATDYYKWMNNRRFEQESRDFYRSQFEKITRELYDIKDFLCDCGIMVECGWVGHRDGYFLATYDDAVDEIDYLHELMGVADDYCNEDNQ